MVGPYRLLRELGRGGMGEVWLAERIDGSLKRQVALKLPHSALPQRQMAERFARERDILANLVHTNIARLYDAGVAPDGQPYLALEYVEGQALTTWCDARQLGIRSRIELFGQVLAAVAYAHSRLVVHRDLKPSNILVTEAGEVRLLDFGIAKLMTDGQAIETELTRVGGRALSLQYASPEQILGQPIATTSDVYALGVVLYELLTGNLPYRLQRDSSAALEEAVLNTEPARAGRTDIGAAQALARGDNPRRLRLALKGDIETILQKALKKQAADRYGSAQAFADDLERWLRGEPVLARPDSTWYRSSKFVRRNRLATGAAAAVVVSLTAGLAVALWQARAAREQARTATAVQAFLLDIFQANSSNQSDPQKARHTTARELLDIGAKKIDAALGDAPVARSTVLATLGDLYIDLGLHEKAITLHRSRVELTRATFGTTSTETAEALIALARAQQHESAPAALAERKAHLEQAEAILDRRNRQASLLRAALYQQQSSLYMALADDRVKANEYASKAVAVYRQLPPSAAGVEAMADAGGILYNLGHIAEARTQLEEALATAGRAGTSADAHLPADSHLARQRAVQPG